MGAHKKTCDLMIPGPVAVDGEVLLEMASPVVAHYGADWVELYLETIDLAKQIFQTRSDLFINVGSGHSGVEAAMCSLLEPGEGAIVVETGHFGRRIAELAASHQAEVHLIEVEWGKTVEPEQVERALASHPTVKVVALVHNETSTGLANPVREIAKICRERDALLAVDAVSSIGGMDLRVDEWGVDVCIAASQKCLEAPPGLALVSVSDRAWGHMRARKKPVHGWYLNLLKWKDAAEVGKHFQPYFITMAVNNVLALRKSMERILHEGLQPRFTRHKTVGQAFREGVRNLGLQVMGKDDEASGILTVFLPPEGREDTEFVSFLCRNYGIQVAGGLSKLAGKTIRVGHMGPGAKMTRVVPVLYGLEQWLKAIGFRVGA
ncbi:MAG: pyridoxal-phosphate-dependent aminotransferase family protein [Bacillota bacterium]